MRQSLAIAMSVLAFLAKIQRESVELVIAFILPWRTVLDRRNMQNWRRRLRQDRRCDIYLKNLFTAMLRRPSSKLRVR